MTTRTEKYGDAVVRAVHAVETLLDYRYAWPDEIGDGDDYDLQAALIALSRVRRRRQECRT